MIITVTTVVVLVVGLISLGVALYGGIISLNVIEGQSGDIETRHTAEQRYYLLGMIGIVVLLARILIVPIFFWMLQSLVPYCPGAMCASGVVNVSEPYSVIAISLKLILPAIYGLWLLIEISNRSQANLPFLSSLAKSFLYLLLPLILIDSAVDVLLVSTIRPIYAPCCSSIYDVNPPFSPSAIFGAEFGMFITILTVIISISLVVIQWLGVDNAKSPWLNISIAFCASILYLITLHDTLAPVVLGLSTHHCPYCLFQEFPDTAIFATLFWVGVVSVSWNSILQILWIRRGLDVSDIQRLSVLLLKVSSVALIFSMTSLVSHLLVAI